MIGGRVFDTSAIVDFATSRTRYAETAVWSGVERGIVVVVPVTALTAALATTPKDRHDIVNVLLDLPITVIEDLTRSSAAPVAGALRPAGGQAPAALIAAHVVHCAGVRGWPILTGEPYPIRALWPEAKIEILP